MVILTNPTQARPGERHTMITYYSPELEKETKVEGNIITLPVKTPLHEYYSGGPLRLSATDSNGQHHQLLFDNPMIIGCIDPKSIRDTSTTWALDWEMCWDPPVISYQPDNDKWCVKYHKFVLKPDGTGDMDAMKVQHVMPDLEFAQAVLFALVIGEDAE